MTLHKSSCHALDTGGGLLRSVNIPADLEAEAMEILKNLDARIVAADPKLSEITETIGQATRIAIGQGPGARPP